MSLVGALYEGCSSNMALKLLEAIVGEFEPVGFTDPEALDCFFDTPDFTIVVFEKA